MRSNQPYIPRKGDVVVWNHASKCSSIAVIMDEDMFSVCLNYHGKKEEETRIWVMDNMPTNVTPHRADKYEMAWLFAELISQGFEFDAHDGRVTVHIESMDNVRDADDRPVDVPQQTVKVECVAMNREQRFANYIFELATLYQRQGSFRNMSDVSRRNNITAMKKELCFVVGLHQLKNPQWLKTPEGTQFCKSLYEFVLHHTTAYPVIPQTQRV